MRVESNTFGEPFIQKPCYILDVTKKIVVQKCAPKLLFVIEKKIKKIPMIFDVVNLLIKSNFCTV